MELRTSSAIKMTVMTTAKLFLVVWPSANETVMIIVRQSAVGHGDRLALIQFASRAKRSL